MCKLVKVVQINKTSWLSPTFNNGTINVLTEAEQRHATKVYIYQLHSFEMNMMILEYQYPANSGSRVALRRR